MPGTRGLLDLDDSCLVHLLTFLTPLPDLFSFGASCRVRGGSHLQHLATSCCDRPLAHALHSPFTRPQVSKAPSPACSQRLRDLALDKRSWLVVTHAASPAKGPAAPTPARPAAHGRAGWPEVA